MNGFTDVCRLCPSNGELLDVFAESKIKEVIRTVTGIDIVENDIVSKKVCQKCCKITLKMYQFRQDALKQDRALKEKCHQFLQNHGIHLPQTSTTTKKEKDIPKTLLNVSRTNNLHPSIETLYKKYPNIKISRKCLECNFAPEISLAKGEVEEYFAKRKLDMNDYIYYPNKKPKTVSPIRICKQIVCSHDKSSSDGITSIYSCSSVKESHRERKHSNDATEGRKSGNFKDATTSFEEQRYADNANPTESIVPSPTTGHVEPVSTSSPAEPDMSNSEIKGTSLCNSPPDKIQFAAIHGLVPAVTATKSQPLFTCHVCGSNYVSSSGLKHHIYKHMMCQFCKTKFKSLEAKESHLNGACPVKNIMNSTGPIVWLDKIDNNLEIRKRYGEVFKDFDPIPGLQELAPVEEVIIRETSPPPVSDNNIIVLSDDEESSTSAPDPLSEGSTSTQFSVTENIVYDRVSIVKPDIRIKNNTILSDLQPGSSDKKILRDLLEHAKRPLLRDLLESHQRPLAEVDRMVQTDLPANKDILIMSSEFACIFKNLKEHLKSYHVPIRVSNGSFHVTYSYEKFDSAAKKVVGWDRLPVVDSKKKNSCPSPLTRTTASHSPIVTTGFQLTVPSNTQTRVSGTCNPATMTQTTTSTSHSPINATGFQLTIPTISQTRLSGTWNPPITTQTTASSINAPVFQLRTPSITQTTVSVSWNPPMNSQAPPLTATTVTKNSSISSQPCHSPMNSHLRNLAATPPTSNSAVYSQASKLQTATPLTQTTTSPFSSPAVIPTTASRTSPMQFQASRGATSVSHVGVPILNVQSNPSSVLTSNTFILNSANSSNSATPHLQNYFRSTATGQAVNKNPVPIPLRFVTSARNIAAVGRPKTASSSSVNGSAGFNSSNNVQSNSLVATTKVSQAPVADQSAVTQALPNPETALVLNSLVSGNPLVITELLSSSSAVAISNPPSVTTTSGSTVSNSANVSENPKFRVKDVWELQ